MIHDLEIREIRRRHIILDVPLSVLSEQTGLSVSMLTKVVNGQRRQTAGGPVRVAGEGLRKYSLHTIAMVMEEICQGERTQLAIARRYGLSRSYVSEIGRKMKGKHETAQMPGM